MTNYKPRKGLIWAAVSTKKQSAEEKFSLPIQVSQAQAFFEREGIEILDVLMVPGHSRRYKDFNELALHAAEKGIDAFKKLEQYWRERAFDVLWVRGGDRFARTQSLHARITEEVIDAGAVIFSSEDGWVDKQNYRMWTAIGGMAAAGNVDKLVEQGGRAKDAMAAKGRYVNGQIWWSHKAIRTEYGRILEIVPDEAKRIIYEDAARLVIEGLGWRSVEAELFKRYGYTNGGKAFCQSFFYHLFHSPGFWGNSGRRYHGRSNTHGQQRDLWVFDPAYPAPETTLIFYGTHEPAISGDLADQLKAELRRRRSAIRGSARPYRSRPFTGLLICGHCGYLMTANTSTTKNWIGHYWRCPIVASPKQYSITCRGQIVTEIYVQAWMDKWLRLMLEKNNPYIEPDGSEPETPRDEAAALEARIEDLTGRIRRLIEKQASASATISSLYDEQIEQAAVELKGLQSRLRDFQSAVAARSNTEIESGFKDLKTYPDLEAFWSQDGKTVNQTLHKIAGSRRLYLLNKKIERVVTRV